MARRASCRPRWARRRPRGGPGSASGAAWRSSCASRRPSGSGPGCGSARPPDRYPGAAAALPCHALALCLGSHWLPLELHPTASCSANSIFFPLTCVRLVPSLPTRVPTPSDRMGNLVPCAQPATGRTLLLWGGALGHRPPCYTVATTTPRRWRAPSARRPTSGHVLPSFSRPQPEAVGKGGSLIPLPSQPSWPFLDQASFSFGRPRRWVGPGLASPTCF